MEREKLSNSELLQLYVCYKDTEKYYLSKEDDYLKIFITNSILVIALWAFVVFKNDFGAIENLFILRKFLLILLSALLVVINVWFSKANKKVFGHNMRLIAQTAKIEDILHFGDENLYCSENYLRKEGLIPKEYFNFRTGVNRPNQNNPLDTSEEFVERYFSKFDTMYKISQDVQIILLIVAIMMVLCSIAITFNIL